jgi:hypothetical protein
VANVELRRLRRVELVNMSPVAHNTFSVGDVEITGHFIHSHFATDGTAFTRI